MKAALKLHLSSIIIAYKLLLKREFIIYLAPPILVTFFYIIGSLLLSSFLSESWAKEISWLLVVFEKLSQVIDFLFTQLYIFIVLTCLSPFNTMLSQKVDVFINNQFFLVNIRQVINEFFRMIFIVLIALVFNILLILFLWLLSQMFGNYSSFIYNIGSFVISAFAIGFTFYDYSLERYKIGVVTSIKFAFYNWAIVLLSGLIFKVLYEFPYIWDIPFIGIIIAPVFTTILSTVIYLRIITKEHNIIQ